MVERAGHRVAVVPGSQVNLKITQPGDLELAEFYLQAAARTSAAARERLSPQDPKPRLPHDLGFIVNWRPWKLASAFGWDSHAFKPGVPLRIGGMTLDHPEGLAGHSDGDVLLHAITDALLGAVAAGDIGSYFPPGDPRWKDADSAIFLKLALEELEHARYRIMNVDITLVLAAPKIAPIAGEMRARVADLLGVDIKQVSIKAKTPEGLGLDHVAQCHAVALVERVLDDEDLKSMSAVVESPAPARRCSRRPAEPGPRRPQKTRRCAHLRYRRHHLAAGIREQNALLNQSIPYSLFLRSPPFPIFLLRILPIRRTLAQNSHLNQRSVHHASSRRNSAGDGHNQNINVEQAQHIAMAILAIMPFIMLIVLAIIILPFWFICKKAGFSPWLSLLNIIPFGWIDPGLCAGVCRLEGGSDCASGLCAARLYPPQPPYPPQS